MKFQTSSIFCLRWPLDLSGAWTIIFDVKLIDNGGRQFANAHIFPYNGCKAVKVGFILFKGFYRFPPYFDLLCQFFLFCLISSGEFQEPFMTDCAADVILINALENAVEFGNALFRLGNFTLAPLGLFFGFLEVLLFRGFLKRHSIVKEQRRHIENPLQDKQFQRFFPDKMRRTSSCIALVIGADIVILLGRKAICRTEIQLVPAIRTVEQTRE